MNCLWDGTERWHSDLLSEVPSAFVLVEIDKCVAWKNFERWVGAWCGGSLLAMHILWGLSIGFVRTLGSAVPLTSPLVAPSLFLRKDRRCIQVR